MKIDANMRVVNNDTLLAVGDIILDDKFVIHQVKVLNLKDADGNKKPVVCMPRKKTKDGWSNAVVIHDKKLQDEINKKVVESVMSSLQNDIGFEDRQIEAKITLYNGSGKVRAYADLVYEGLIEIKGIQIREEKDGLKTVYPYNMSDDDFQSLFGATTVFVKGKLDRILMDAYNDAIIAHRKEPERGMCI